MSGKKTEAPVTRRPNRGFISAVHGKNRWVRPTFAIQLEALEGSLESNLGLAVHILGGLDKLILHPTQARAEALIAAGSRLRSLGRKSDLELITLSATQAPVACDLQLVLTMTQIVQSQGLIANQFGLIGEQLTLIDSGLPDRCGTGAQTAELAGLAREQLAGALEAFVQRDSSRFEQLSRSDDRLDRLNREICQSALALRPGPALRALAFRHVLIARSLERIGDNAIRIARHTAELVRADVHRLAVFPA